jgi:hypothetical protein
MFCFYKERVFLCCLDGECCQRIVREQKIHEVMAKELEEDIYFKDTWKVMSTTTDTFSHGGDSIYKLTRKYVGKTLGTQQIEFLESLRAQKREILRRALFAKASSAAASSSSAAAASTNGLAENNHGHYEERNMPRLRDISKVPWRNVYSSINGKWVWVEINMPMLQSYVSWKNTRKHP